MPHRSLDHVPRLANLRSSAQHADFIISNAGRCGEPFDLQLSIHSSFSLLALGVVGSSLELTKVTTMPESCAMLSQGFALDVRIRLEASSSEVCSIGSTSEVEYIWFRILHGI